MTKEIEEAKKLLVEGGADADAIDAYIELGIGDDDLSDFEEAYQGQYRSDVDFVQELLESCGDIPKDLPCYIHIDWEWTAKEIMMDYSEQDGYYFRNL